MPYAMFYQYFPEIAKEETRCITIFDDSDTSLPAGEYAFLEMFCDEPKCDCRRVFFYVVFNKSKEAAAVITYGWENPKFYMDWLRYDDPAAIEELQGPALNTWSPQTQFAPALLRLFQDMLLHDKDYIDRVKRHYRMFRDKIDHSGKRSGINIRKKKKRKS